MSDDAIAHYDRATASRVLAELGGSDRFLAEVDVPATLVEYHAVPMEFDGDETLTLSQRLYLERFMRPCRPEEVTSATHRVTWLDEDGVANTGHFHADGLGPIVPIAARGACLALSRALRADSGFRDRAAALDRDARIVLAATTTDQEPADIFRVGFEATARALAQHALLAHRTPHRSPIDFAVAMRDSGLFTAVATRWFWELQASTYRRGMIPVTLDADPGGRLRYSPRSIATLRAMKDATIADAHTVMTRARTVEGLDTEEAIAKYHDELDLVSRQYALLAPGARPVCLASVPHRVGTTTFTLLPLVVERFVEAFAVAVRRCEIRARTPEADLTDDMGARTSFAVPDMNCKHCVLTIGSVLASMDIVVHEIDLDRKTVRAEFRSPRNRERAFAALRDSGYNPVAAVGEPTPTAKTAG
ncbi:heavy-metal-associated domain-containing protein [Nocardia sp. NBC_01377]|uniref:heavy-metal-associated domain-containing protein n=1 Tax=Nocardia sp. NBC_01377 TaxID=2903595 RepID=UPI0032543587